MQEFISNSRPKINRLPPSSIQGDFVEVADGRIIWRSLWLFVSLVVIFLGFVIYQRGGGSVSVADVSPDDRRLLELVNSYGDNVRKGDSEIYIKDGGEVIVGQMVRIASESGKIMPVNAVAENGKANEGELLAILSKH